MILTQEYSRIVSSIKDHRGPGPGADYFSIGHGEAGYGYYVWIWLDGQLDVRGPYGEPHGGKKESHSTLWSRDVIDVNYRGRFDEWTGEVSIAVPGEWASDPIPSPLIAQLESKFEPTNIHIF